MSFFFDSVRTVFQMVSVSSVSPCRGSGKKSDNPGSMRLLPKSSTSALDILMTSVPDDKSTFPPVFLTSTHFELPLPLLTLSHDFAG